MTKPFRLSGLLRIRSVQERLAAEDAARAAREHSTARAREAGLREQMGASRSDATNPATLMAVAVSRSANRAMLAEARAVVEVRAQAAEKARSAHQAARIEEGGLQKLADAHAERERERELQAELTELDEIAIRPKKQKEER